MRWFLRFNGGGDECMWKCFVGDSEWLQEVIVVKKRWKDMKILND